MHVLMRRSPCGKPLLYLPLDKTAYAVCSFSFAIMQAQRANNNNHRFELVEEMIIAMRRTGSRYRISDAQYEGVKQVMVLRLKRSERVPGRSEQGIRCWSETFARLSLQVTF